MKIHFVTGGARSGKSRHAEELARSLGGDDVTYLATAEALDSEMAERISKHRSRRPSAWQTLECARHVAAALNHIHTHVVLLDCLTLLACNVFASDDHDAGARDLAAEIDALLAVAAARPGDLIIVSNEIGSGIVPDHALSRAFRDALGTANQQVARAADSVTLLVSGVPLVLKTAQ